MAWRLGLDLGTNSIGWCVLELGADSLPCNLLGAGVRIFSDGREPAAKGRIGDSLAVVRRGARGMRRNRDRRISRKKTLADYLIGLGALQKNSPHCPYECRAKAVSGTVTKDELGRALFHLGQRRGFLSNRKTDSDEETAFKSKISALRAVLAERKQTLGQYLFDREQTGQSLRFRGDEGDYYPDRRMYKEEFALIRDKQAAFFTPEQWDAIDNIIFHQRPLKPVEKGKCQFYHDQDRAHAGLPIAHTYRIAQEVNNLRWLDEGLAPHRLDAEQRHVLYTVLHQQKSLSWSAMRSKLKRADGTPLFPKASKFNFEDADNRRTGLKGNDTYIDLSGLFGALWEKLDQTRQNDLVELMYDAAKDEEVAGYCKSIGFTDEQAAQACKYKLPSATYKVSRHFMQQIIPPMMEEGLRYDEAVLSLGLHHSYDEDGEIFEKLPYYGAVLLGSTIGGNPSASEDEPERKYGKIGNPTVHVALNQIRRVVNALVDRYGLPDQIHLEVGRELKQSRDDRAEMSKKIAKNEKENDRIREKCRKLGLAHPAAMDVKKYKLWEELGTDRLSRQCPFSGASISAAMLFNGDVEIEHILPFSQTKDNGMMNMTLATRQANRIKRNRCPYDARHDFAAQGWAWEDILERAKKLPQKKRDRFGESASQEWLDTTAFLDRQVTDNSYIAKIARRYLGKLCGGNNVVCVSGQLSGLLRGKWRLNNLLNEEGKKMRDDHRHHAVDAIVVGMTSRSIIQGVNTNRTDDGRIHYDVPALPQGLYQQAQALLNTMIISVKPDHGKNGKFFNDTAYGFVGEEQRDADLKDYNLVVRKPIDSLSNKEITNIRDPYIRGLVINYFYQQTGENPKDSKLDDKKRAALLHDFGHKEWPRISGQARPMRSIRILVANQKVEPIPSAPYKGYAIPNFICCDIYRVPKGKAGAWKKGEYKYEGVFWSYIDIQNGEKDDKKPHPAAKFLMRLYKDDMVVLERNGKKDVMRVYGYSTTNNCLDLRPQYQTDGKQTFVGINTVASTMKKINLSPDGKVA